MPDRSGDHDRPISVIPRCSVRSRRGTEDLLARGQREPAQRPWCRYTPRHGSQREPQADNGVVTCRRCLTFRLISPHALPPLIVETTEDVAHWQREFANADIDHGRALIRDTQGQVFFVNLDHVAYVEIVAVPRPAG